MPMRKRGRRSAGGGGEMQGGHQRSGSAGPQQASPAPIKSKSTSPRGSAPLSQGTRLSLSSASEEVKLPPLSSTRPPPPLPLPAPLLPPPAPLCCSARTAESSLAATTATSAT